MSRDDEIVRKGAVTEFRPRKDDVSGGRDKSVQTEALGAEGSTGLQSSGSSSGGAAGRIGEVGAEPEPLRAGGPAKDEEDAAAGGEK